jgi:hypothetical protein
MIIKIVENAINGNILAFKESVTEELLERISLRIEQIAEDTADSIFNEEKSSKNKKKKKRIVDTKNKAAVLSKLEFEV